MSRDAYSRFLSSMQIGYEQWHDGTGYDLEALEQMSDQEKASIEQQLIPRAGNDWRDLEALDRLGTPNTFRAIARARNSSDIQIRIQAHEYGPEPTGAEWNLVLLDALDQVEVGGGLSIALDCAIEHPSPEITAKLWKLVEAGGRMGIGYHCAAALCCMSGVIDSIYDDTYRQLFLKFLEIDSESRRQALVDLKKLTSGQP